MKRENQLNSGIQFAKIRVDSRGQRYLIYPDGQMKRIAPNGHPVPRVKMSKKERVRLRREYSGIRELDAEKLADKILKTSVVNPVVNSASESGNLSADEYGNA